MIDMGQADRTLRFQPTHSPQRMCWTQALRKAANDMGYDHYLDVPSQLDTELREAAKQIRANANH